MTRSGRSAARRIIVYYDALEAMGNFYAEGVAVSEWFQIMLCVIAGLILVWLVMVFVLWFEQRKNPDRASLLELLRLAPDVVRLLKRLATDRNVPIGARIWLGALFVYLVSPIDLIPDFIPVLGYADDALVVVLALRFAVKRAGEEAITEHWPGTAAGLEAVLRLTGLARRGQ